MIKKFIIVFVSLFLWQSCKYGETKVYKNKEIPPVVAKQISRLNDRLTYAMGIRNLNEIKSLWSDELYEKTKSDFTKYAYLFARSLKNTKYCILDEYYVIDSSAFSETDINFGKGTDFEYNFKYPLSSEETYISLLTVGNLQNETLLSIVWGRDEDNWKVNMMNLSDFRYLGYTAPGLVHQASVSYEKGAICDATCYSLMMQNFLHPCLDIFSYAKEADFLQSARFYQEEFMKIYELPREMDHISTKPIFYFVGVQTYPTHWAPIVCYQTTIPLNDTEAIHSEYIQIRDSVYKMCSGLNENKKMVIFRAFNLVPDSNFKNPFYQNIDTLSAVN